MKQWAEKYKNYVNFNFHWMYSWMNVGLWTIENRLRRTTSVALTLNGEWERQQIKNKENRKKKEARVKDHADGDMIVSVHPY